MEYTIIKNTDLQYLIKSVNAYIKDGWQPQGGICCNICSGLSIGPSFIYFQALIRGVEAKYNFHAD